MPLAVPPGQQCPNKYAAKTNAARIRRQGCLGIPIRIPIRQRLAVLADANDLGRLPGQGMQGYDAVDDLLAVCTRAADKSLQIFNADDYHVEQPGNARNSVLACGN